MPATPIAPPAVPDLGQAMIPLDGTDPTRPLDDLDALREIVGDARIVALGEPTHGQREVFQLKHRIIAWLVENTGFTTFALEASVAGCRPMSRYVLNGEGDPEAAVKAQGFWTWSTEEVLALILWMREWNIAHPGRPVDVAGVDTQEAVFAHQSLTTFLINQSSQLAIDSISESAAIAAIVPGQTPYDAGEHARYLAFLADLDQRIDELPDADPDEVAVQHDNLLAMRQFLTLWAASPGGSAAISTARDRVMAERTAPLATGSPDARVVLWAHNAHVTKSLGTFYGDSRIVPMGLNLKARFVEDIVIIGILFGSGSYQGVIQNVGIQDIDVGEPPTGSLDAALLAASPAPASLLDLRDLPAPLQEWLGSPHVTRVAGALAVPSEDMLSEINVIQAFDVLAFIRETTSARPL